MEGKRRFPLSTHKLQGTLFILIHSATSSYYAVTTALTRAFLRHVWRSWVHSVGFSSFFVRFRFERL